MMNHLIKIIMKYIKLLIILLFAVNIYAQNLVPNPGFEEGDYHGGNYPINYYSPIGNFNPEFNPPPFDKDIDHWFTARPSGSQDRESPDWIKGGLPSWDDPCPDTPPSFYVRSGLPGESIMTKMVYDYTLVKGRTYHFTVKVRCLVSSGSFQVVFSTEHDGLDVFTHKKWTALYFDVPRNCHWKTVEGYFTVPTDKDKDYEDMKYIVLQWNNGVEPPPGEKPLFNYDDVTLVEELTCLDHKYVQNWTYYSELRIVQANMDITAGENVTPPTWTVGPVELLNVTNGGDVTRIIYQSPVVYLQPGFRVDKGANFETLTGKCEDNPCPSIPSFKTPGPLVCGDNLTFGGAFPPEQPGLNYSWKPEAYFSDPWSRNPTFTPPEGSGCVDASLSIWNVCGKKEKYSFPLRYFSGPAVATISGLQSGANFINFNVQLSNVESYTIVVTDPLNGNTVLYQQTYTVDCESASGLSFPVNFNPCSFSMCDGHRRIKVIAHNSCYPDVETSFLWISPEAITPVISISNLVVNDYNFDFDVAVGPTTEWVKVEVWNETMSHMICTKTFSVCDFAPGTTSIHWHEDLCFTGAVPQCANHKVKIMLKNMCTAAVASTVLNWNKSNTTATIVSLPPDVVSVNGDGIDDALCFTVQGVDHYSIVIYDLLGNVVYMTNGSIFTSPLCIWYPQDDIPDGQYQYHAVFTNVCDGMAEHTDIVTVNNSFNFTGQAEKSFVGKTIHVYPNPSDGLVGIDLGERPEQGTISVYDYAGKEILKQEIKESMVNVDLSAYSQGLYFIRIQTDSQSVVKTVVIE
jgi:hypothetical protein